MILEVAILDVKAGQSEEFKAAFDQAQTLIAGMNGYLSHRLNKCIEKPDRYILLVEWQTLEAHEVGFRQSKEYLEWKKLLHHFYEPFPEVEHYQPL